MAATDRIRDIVQRWFLSEPLLFGAWTTHELCEQFRLKTIRVGGGKIEFNPEFIDSISDQTLAEVMRFEAVRIILKHPYERKKQHPEAAWQGSNIAIQECIQSPLDFPRARDFFESDEYDRKFYEFYYGLILERESGEDNSPNSEEGAENSENEPEDSDEGDSNADSKNEGKGSGEGGGEGEGESDAQSESSLAESYFDPSDVGQENTESWDDDAMLSDRIDEVISEIQANQNWGTLSGKAQELIEATLRPKLDYRRVLHAFRASVISMRRRLTRLKPSRRYGFQFMGSKGEFSTRLLFAVDVSGSVSSEDVSRAFSIVNRFFKYGVESVDVIWFDSEIQSEEPLSLKKAIRNVKVSGRGGTEFQPVVDHLENHPEYEGLIVFTDGIAPAPVRSGRNRKARIVWLFNTEDNWKRLKNRLEGPGMWSAFVQAD